MEQYPLSQSTELNVLGGRNHEVTLQLEGVSSRQTGRLFCSRVDPGTTPLPAACPPGSGLRTAILSHPSHSIPKAALSGSDVAIFHGPVHYRRQFGSRVLTLQGPRLRLGSLSRCPPKRQYTCPRRARHHGGYKCFLCHPGRRFSSSARLTSPDRRVSFSHHCINNGVSLANYRTQINPIFQNRRPKEQTAHR